MSQLVQKSGELIESLDNDVKGAKIPFGFGVVVEPLKKAVLLIKCFDARLKALEAK